MTAGMIVFWVVIGLLVVFACWLMIQAKHPIDAPEENNEAPYKLESPSASDLVAVSEQPKKRGRPLGSKNKPRKYNKRSPYWTSGKLKVKMAKDRKARRQQNQKLK